MKLLRLNRREIAYKQMRQNTLPSEEEFFYVFFIGSERFHNAEKSEPVLVMKWRSQFDFSLAGQHAVVQ